MNDDLKTQLIERITELLNASNFETALPHEENVRLARAQARASTVLERLTGVEFQFEIKEEAAKLADEINALWATIEEIDGETRSLFRRRKLIEKKIANMESKLGWIMAMHEENQSA